MTPAVRGVVTPATLGVMTPLMDNESDFETLRAGLVAHRVERVEDTEGAAGLLSSLVNSIHVEADTLAEALWREKFCRPVDSREAARRLILGNAPCSTCSGQTVDPPCCYDPESGVGFHTYSGGTSTGQPSS